MVYNQFMQFLRIYIFEAVLRTLYSVRCTVNRPYTLVYNSRIPKGYAVAGTLYDVQCTRYSIAIRCTLYSVYVYTVHCTSYTIRRILFASYIYEYTSYTSLHITSQHVVSTLK